MLRLYTEGRQNNFKKKCSPNQFKNLFKKKVELANKYSKNEEFFCFKLKVLANEEKNVDSFTVSRENLFSEACQELKQIRKKPYISRQPAGNCSGTNFICRESQKVFEENSTAKQQAVSRGFLLITKP